jgi:predicted O-methyltransferase YrrM
LFWRLKYKTWGRDHGLSKRGDTLLRIIKERKPRHFLEIGVFTGVTAKNICMLLKKLHGNDYSYIGIDLFEEIDNEQVAGEKAPKILQTAQCSIESVYKFLEGYNVRLYKGNSTDLLKNISGIDTVDFVFLDGGHSYNTVYSDLSALTKYVRKDVTILCDDYAGITSVTEAINDFAKDRGFKVVIHDNPSVWKFAEIIR